jgi:hypothetical protein
MTIERRTQDDPRPLYEYSVATVSGLLLCLKPHVLRAIRENLQERESEFTGSRAPELSELLVDLDELLESLDGDVELPEGDDA